MDIPGVESAMQYIDNFMKSTGQVMMVFGAVFALLNCFFGYKLIKIWSAVLGFIIGFFLGFFISLNFIENAGICAVIGVAAGLAVGALAFIIYKAGVFLFCLGSVFFFVIGFLPATWGVTATVIAVVAGVAVGVLAMIFMGHVIIITSGVSGGISAANTLLPIFGVSLSPVIMAVGLVVAAGGIFVQYKTTPKRDLKG